MAASQKMHHNFWLGACIVFVDIVVVVLVVVSVIVVVVAETFPPLTPSPVRQCGKSV